MIQIQIPHSVPGIRVVIDKTMSRCVCVLGVSVELCSLKFEKNCSTSYFHSYFVIIMKIIRKVHNKNMQIRE